MNVNDAWNNFIASGSPLSYIEYSQLKQVEEAKNADSNQGACNKGNGYKG